MPIDFSGEVLCEILALGGRRNDARDEDKGLVIRSYASGHTVAAWAVYPRITYHDIWTYAPDAPKALELLLKAMRAT